MCTGSAAQPCWNSKRLLDHLFSSSLIALKRYPPRRAVRSCRLELDVLFSHTYFSPRLHSSCCARIYRWQASNSCCDHDRLSYFSTYVCAEKSFLWVEECQWLLFLFRCLSSKQGLPQAVLILFADIRFRPPSTHGRSFLSQIRSFVFLCIFEPFQGESMILFSVVLLFYWFTLFY